MNLGYKVTEDDIEFFSSLTSVPGYWPKYKHAEAILLLENEIETIDKLIEDREEIIDAIDSKWYCKHYNTIAKCLIGLGITSVSGALITLITTLLSVTTNLPWLFICVITCVASAFPALMHDKANTLKKHESSLTLDIAYLQRIKHQKQLEIETLKQEIDQDMEPTKDKTLSKPKLTKLQAYREALKLIQDMQIEPTEFAIQEVKQLVEEVDEQQNQKTLRVK